MKLTKYAFIGAGGIGCFAVPMLSKMMPGVICDADTYEPGNATRQFPALTSTGNKAEVLCNHLAPHTIHDLLFIPRFMKDIMITSEEEWQGVDLIVGGVDNNLSRRIIIDVAGDLGIPAILGGNSHEHGEAHLFLPGVYNPIDYFDFSDSDPAPWSCNHEKTLEAHPQTAVANCLAAGCIMQLYLSLVMAIKPHNCIVHARSDAFSSSFSRAKDLLAAAGATA